MNSRTAISDNGAHVAEPVESGANLARDRIIAASTKLDADRYKTEFVVPDMHCAGCMGSIERGFAELPMVEKVRANLSLKSVSVIWKASKGNAVELEKRLNSLGYDHHLIDGYDESKAEDSGRSMLLALAVAGFAAANIMLLSISVWSGATDETAQLFHIISGLIAVPAVAFSGRVFFRSAIKSLSAGRLNMDVPISLAVLMALGMSVHESLSGGAEAYFDASVMLLFFLLIGRYLDLMMRGKARGAVERLSSLSAKNGVLVHPNGETGHIDLMDIRPGMQLRVFPGERFPVNGVISSGETDLNRSHVTGESDSAFAKTGDAIEAGALNLTAPVDIEATTSADTSFLADMRNMMEAAENGRGEYIRIADRMAQIYAPAVHLLAFATFAFWMIASSGDWHLSIYTAIAVLIVTCPCALGLAVPVAHVIGANRLMQNGILMRDGTALERLATIDGIVFDKTGTLTEGFPVVTSVQGKIGTALPLLKAMASASNHPIAKAIGASLGEAGNAALRKIREIPGFGIEAECNGKLARLGKPEWVSEIASGTGAGGCERFTASFAREGLKAVHFELEDTLRDGATDAIGDLRNRSLEMEILSGDNASNVSRVANLLGIDRRYSGQTPEQKINRINARKEQGGKTLMVGDGINDAPALAAGHVSMVPSSASDIGRHSADFVFIRQSLSVLPVAFEIAKFTDRAVKQNFGLAIAYNCIAVPLAMCGYVTPLVAAIAMSASSILVIANSFRINLAGKPKPAAAASSTNFANAMEAAG